LLLLCLLLAGCNNEGPATNDADTTPEAATNVGSPVSEGGTDEAGTGDPQPSDADTIASPPQPEAGKVMVVGSVVSRETGEPLADTAVRLAEIYRNEGEGEDNFALDAALSPGALTNEQGSFMFSNIGEYVIIVGNVEGVEAEAYEIIANPDGSGRVVNAEADQIVDIGELEVTLSGVP
jgi:hypothetical protein